MGNPLQPSTDPAQLLTTAIWQALTTAHQPLAIVQGLARRYPAAVAPFAAMQAVTPTALDDLLALLAPGEFLYLLGDRPPEHPGLQWNGFVPCLQMVFPPQATLPEGFTRYPVLPLTCDDAPHMLALIAVAYPGYFRPETCRMGRYWGIRDDAGHLIAMGGERFILAPPGEPVWPEISGLCVHPDHAGRALGTAVLGHILAQHRREDSRSWLHVTEDNAGAIALYRRLGFTTVQRVEAHRVKRSLA